MILKDVYTWQSYIEKNTDPYGARICSYAEDWANLMEEELAKGRKIEEFADETSHTADTDGITGFMYGAAVHMLATCWIHGEELRRWHNLKYQVHNEGEQANKNGATLNPAVLIIGE